MRHNVVWTVFRKELTDLLRDRKTLIGTFVIPLVIIPFVFFLLSMSYTNVEKEARAYVPIAVNGQSILMDYLKKQTGVQLLSPAEPQTELEQGRLRAIISIPENFDQQVKAGKKVRVEVAYDSTNQKSMYARTVIEEAVKSYSEDIVNQRLRQAGLSEQAIKPIETVYDNTASKDRQAGGMLAGIVPLMLVLSLASGGIAAATDLVVGERERGTLEALLTAPIAANHLLTAKLLAVMVMSCMSAMASLLSLTFVFRMGPFNHTAESSFSLRFLEPGSLVVLGGTILLLAAMFAGLELTLSTIAKSFKEGQTYMTGVIVLAMVPSYMMMPVNPVDIPQWAYYLPIFSGVALVKEVFYGAIQPWHIFVGMGTSLLYVAGIVALSARLFRREGAVIKG
ncbi:ABC transporter permease [Brevibacillus ruminantium]|uniref:ABC transporter permease n=1 Tax=Brevibacillus ruminantium TaxID=2950604 RepID=A0ABY4WH63_9BACL|nr:ABC transporter permease [Brevibacillus ruminantium]USG66462.1 ABC transporter permease [Brevibacillus ruminantium]